MNLLLQGSMSPDGFWPVTATGWITLIGFVLMIGGAVFASGKFMGVINGFGKRLNEVEGDLKASKQDRVTLRDDVRQMLSQHEAMIEKLGEARANSQKCNDDTEVMGRRIEAKIDDTNRGIAKVDKEVSSRLAALEAVLMKNKPGDRFNG